MTTTTTMVATTEEVNNRKPEFSVEDIFLKRHSPRAMSGESISKEELMSLFEAAKWAPSAYNGQPWKFLYAMRDTPEWETFFNLMGEFNQTWTKNAAVLIVLVSNKNFEHNGQPSKTHSFDTGAAWENLALQASLSGLVAHGMSGFDYEKAKKDLEIPDDFEVEAMIAIGKPGEKEKLPENLQAGEIPNGRKSVSDFAIEGKFKK